MSNSRLSRCAVWGLAALAVPVVAEAQQGQGAVRGRVTATQGNAPIASAQIAVDGTTLGARTGPDGTFIISGIPAGERTLRLVRIGFSAQSRSVTIAAGDTIEVNFALAPTAVQLSQVVVSATGESVQRRQQGTTVSSISVADTVQLAAVQNFSQLVQGRAAGVTITQSAGTLGAGASVRIRGSNSLSLSNEPLLVIDGVRINSDAAASTIGVGGQSPSRLNDLNPQDIESIEILKGPAASTLYGTAAANGVIQITTRRGRSGAAQWQAWTEYGQSEEVWGFVDNYAVLDATGARRPGGLPGVAAGTIEFGSVQQYNPLANSDIIRKGDRRQYGLSVSGGTPQATYYLSGDFTDEKGIYLTNAQDRVNLRANVQANLSDKLQVSANSGYLSSNLLSPQNDNNGLGVIGNALLGNSNAESSTGGFLAFDPIISVPFRVGQDLERFTGSTNANYRPLSWLNVIGTAGLDVQNRTDYSVLPPNTILTSANNRIGSRTRNQRQVASYTATGTAIATFNPLPWLQTTTTLGGQFLRENFSGTNASGFGLLAGSGSLEGLSERFSVGETNQDERTIGFYGRQQFGFNDRAFITASVRSDANSNFGTNVGYVTYPQVEGSWVISEEEFFPAQTFMDQFRVRAAWGQSGLPPTFRTAFEFFTPTPVRVNGVEIPAFTIGGPGNVALEPEVISETELGFDAGFLGGRLGLEFTYFSKLAEDAIVARRLPPSQGLTATQLANIGELANWGTEWLLNAQLWTRPNFALDATVNFSTLKQNLNSLREGVEPIIFGLGGDSQRHEVGYPMGGYWGANYTYSDANNDGLLSRSEVTIEEDQVFLGSPEPSRVLGLTLNASFLQNFRVSTLIDYRGGHKLFNSTEEFRCGFGNCQGLNDPSASLDDQARAIAATASSPTIAGYVEDADFVRLREVSLTYQLPESFANSLRFRGASFTVAGRNLGLWTDYTGADPELNFGGQGGYTRADFLTQPPVRSFNARFQLQF